MTKLEAWKAWCEYTGTGDRLANEFTLESSSHGKAFSFAWDAAHEACAKVCKQRITNEPGMQREDYENRQCAAAIRARGEPQ